MSNAEGRIYATGQSFSRHLYLHKGAAGLVEVILCVCCQSPREEGGTQVDRYAGEPKHMGHPSQNMIPPKKAAQNHFLTIRSTGSPLLPYHEHAECDTLWTVLDDVEGLVLVVRQDGGIVQHHGQQVHLQVRVRSHYKFQSWARDNTSATT